MEKFRQRSKHFLGSTSARFTKKGGIMIIFMVLLLAMEVFLPGNKLTTRAKGCPATSSNQIYNACQSAMTNRGIAFADQTISTTIDTTNRLQVTSSVALAGAIASIKLNGKEFIASEGHGSALQFALHAHYNDAGATECYNPTEAGSKTDDAQPGWSSPPYHGPSTSALTTLNSTSNQIHTSSRLAFYIPRGAKSDFNGCQPDYPSGEPYDSGRSPYLLSKTVSVGIQPETGELENVIQVNAQVNIEAPETSSSFDAVLIAYMQPDFNTYFKYHADTGTANYISWDQYVQNPGIGSSSDPIIISTSDGAYALGIYSPMSLNTAQQETQYYYLGYNSGSNPNYPFQSQTMQLTFPAHNIQAGTLSYQTYFVVGNLQCVEDTLSILQSPSKVRSC